MEEVKLWAYTLTISGREEESEEDVDEDILGFYMFIYK
jgi:hypothetical protein